MKILDIQLIDILDGQADLRQLHCIGKACITETTKKLSFPMRIGIEARRRGDKTELSLYVDTKELGRVYYLWHDVDQLYKLTRFYNLIKWYGKREPTSMEKAFLTAVEEAYEFLDHQFYEDPEITLHLNSTLIDRKYKERALSVLHIKPTKYRILFDRININNQIKKLLDTLIEAQHIESAIEIA